MAAKKVAAEKAGEKKDSDKENDEGNADILGEQEDADIIF